MTDTTLLGTRATHASVDGPALLPGIGSLPAPLARQIVADPDAQIWLRRLYTSPGGRDLVAMDSHRRTFTGQLRRLLVLRDQTCQTPWCDAPIRAADHVHPAAHGGPTSAANGAGICQRCNLTKEELGWAHQVAADGRTGPHTIRITTPTGHTYDSTAPPILGLGWNPPPEPQDDDLTEPSPAFPLEPYLYHLLEAC